MPVDCFWITGASSGIGRALAVELARSGETVVASARNAQALEELANESASLRGRIVGLPLDVTDPAAIGQALATIESQHGRIGTAVLNAGTHFPFGAADFSSEKFHKLLNINVMGTVYCLEAIMPKMIAAKRGRIAVVASLAGYAGLPSAAGYGASKAALINMTESLRPDLERHGVTIQLVNPGFVRTPLTDKNDFDMPFLMESDDAAKAFAKGLRSNAFEIRFPWKFAWIMKALRALPYPLFFPLTRKMVR